MQAKLAQLLAMVIHHLIMKWWDMGKSKYDDYQHAKKTKAEATRKLEEHKNAQTREERRKTFDGLSILVFCFLSFGFGSCSSTDRDLSLTTDNCELDAIEVEIDGKRYVDVSESVCFCRPYEFSIGHVGPIGVVRDEPYDYCKQMPGFKKWDEVSSFWEIVRNKLSVKPKKSKDL